MWWILLALGVSLAEGCPKDVMKQVTHCMNPLEVYSADQGGIFMFMSSLEKTSQLCSEGKIQYAFSCLNDLYNKCAKSREGTQQFDLLVDVGRWQQAMENICDNIHYLKDHADCEAKANLEYRPCADKEVSTFNHELSTMWTDISTQGELSEEQRMESVMDAGCSFTVKILDCLRTPFERFCPPELTNLLVNTVEDFMPPACVKRALINSIHKIPKYKGTKYEKLDTQTETNRQETIQVEAVIATSQSVVSGADDKLDRGAAEYIRDDAIKINSPSPGSDGMKEAIGSVESSEMAAENGNPRISGVGARSIMILVTLILCFLLF